LRLYERLPVEQVFCVPTLDRMDCGFISGLQCGDVSAAGIPDEIADPRLICSANPKLKQSFRFGESRSELSCRHTPCLRKLSAITLSVKKSINDVPRVLEPVSRSHIFHALDHEDAPVELADVQRGDCHPLADLMAIIT